MTTAPSPPDWQPVPCGADFTAAAGPMRMARIAGGLIFQVRIGAQHCNLLDVCHGGMIATFVDQAMGMAVVERLADPALGAATISLNVDYLAAARRDDVLETTPAILRIGRAVGYCETRVAGPRGLVARASGTFRLPGG